MSPTSSAQASGGPSKPSHSRHTSSVAVPNQEPRAAKAASPRPSPIIEARPNVHYTCFIRLPFPRGDFQDPLPVNWDAIKDKALWKLISQASSSKELKWEEIATRFDVGLPFLLQQAAWLYERHFEGMRKQMQSIGVSQAPTPTLPESGASSGTAAQAGGVAMQRQGSRGAARMPPVINTLKAQPSVARGSDGSSPGTPRSTHPAISRTPSTTTVTQSRLLAGSSGKQPLQRAFRTSSESQRPPPAVSRPAGAAHDDEYALGHDGQSESESEEEPSMARSRKAVVTRKPALRALSSDGDAEDDEDDSSGGYLPFAATVKAAKVDTGPASNDPTKRHSGGQQQPGPASAPRKPKESTAPAPESSASSASSAKPPPSSSDPALSNERPPGPISPRHRAQLAHANISPRYRRREGREGSEGNGSPSLGSSFSDLDVDASVTQSALEEALLSNMQQPGGMSIAGRLGGLGGGLRDAMKRQ
ncbi:hypothetical protein LTR29_012324 [Friedmanniomyces endolithicus]|nr:hypothetical protein LTR29_012324 [Friedmanniomyces endolithicus]KAK1814709.1 hypothetical protein LTR12_010931 [Friedmanniomyces endolithicus]